jgi:hypothetical protein
MDLNYVEMYGLDSYGSGSRQEASSGNNSYETSKAIKVMKFFDCLSNYWLLKEGSAPWS